MPLDKFDIKIQEAASHYQPALDEAAWEKMARLLDVHLPQKEDDKRKYAWWFLLLFILIAIMLVILKPWNIGGRGVLYTKGKIVVALAPVVKSNNKETNVFSKKNGSPGNTIRLGEPRKNFVPMQNSAVHGKQVYVLTNLESNHIAATPGKTPAININAQKNVNVSDDIVAEYKKSNSDPANNVCNIAQPALNDQEHVNTNLKKDSVPSSAKTKNSSAKNDKQFAHSFFLNFSAGADVSGVRLSGIGKINAIYGAGIGYNIGNKWSLRTGFYFSKKAYKVNSSDYHPPSGFWNYYPNLEYINAIFKIYEVPLIINYHFKHTPANFWFASAGLSSYFMKKEKYTYYPKDPESLYPTNSYVLNNQNKHIFSSLRLSGGYSAVINKNVSLAAEPYVNLPLYGIGYGKDKLYNAGVLFSVSVKPFAR